MSKADALAGDPPAAKVPGTAAFSKFMHVLQLIAESDEPLSLSRIAALSGYPRTTVYRLLGALLAEDMVAENRHRAGYELGSRLISLAGKSLAKSDLRSVALEPLRALRDATRETVHLAIPSAMGMVYIEKLESPQTVRMDSRIGTRVTWYSSSVGKAYLACLEHEPFESRLRGIRLEKLTPNTVDSLDALRREIDQARQRGYALDQEENEPQIFCIGCAILRDDGAPAGCVSISIPVFRKNRKLHETYAIPLLETCRLISKKLSRKG
jgi:DNA-binding IclR family transcriptional regulator